VFNDTTELLLGSWQKARNVRKCHNRDLESITEPNKTSRLDGCINVQTPCKNLRLVSNYTYRFPFDFNEASKDVLSKGGHDFVVLVPVCNCFEDKHHIIWFVGVVRDNVVQNFS